MEANTEAIIRLAWSRLLSLDDDALAPLPGRRIYRRDEGAEAVSFLSLFGQSVFSGPSWAVEQAERLDDDRLRSLRTILTICSGHHGRSLGEATLAYADEYVELPDLDGLVSKEPDSLAALERTCPPDDVSEVRLGEMDQTFVLVEEETPTEAIAGSGYSEWAGILAQVGVLTGLAHRRTGHGRSMAGVATNEALDAGLVPQWRARADNPALRRISATLGYTEVGSQTTVLLRP